MNLPVIDRARVECLRSLCPRTEHLTTSGPERAVRPVATVSAPQQPATSQAEDLSLPAPSVGILTGRGAPAPRDQHRTDDYFLALSSISWKGRQS